MPPALKDLTDIIEECYEFTLSYAAQGLATDEGAASGAGLRRHLADAATALRQLDSSCARAIESGDLAPAEASRAFAQVLAGDAAHAAAAIDLVLAQPAIGSQLIDNLNASMHLRALLTDLFLLTEIVDARRPILAP
jgi:hypothetical protein